MRHNDASAGFENRESGDNFLEDQERAAEEAKLAANVRDTLALRWR